MSEDKYEYVGRQVHGTIIGRSDQSSWERAATHRAHVLRLLPDRGQRRGVLAIFGMGDGSAIDLARLLQRFHEIHIVDSDARQVALAIQKQNLAERQRIFHREIDTTGISELLTRYADQPNRALYDEILAGLERRELPDVGQFDAILSHGVIPSIMEQATQCITDDPQRLAPLIPLLRQQHIDQLFSHLSPGGQMIIVLDIVSSSTHPELSKSPENVQDSINRAVQTGNFFPGAHPNNVDQDLLDRKSRLLSLDITKPWIRETVQEHIACIAFRIQTPPAPEAVA